MAAIDPDIEISVDVLFADPPKTKGYVKFTPERVRAYLVSQIRTYRALRDRAADTITRAENLGYIAAFQDVHRSLFGEVVPT